MDFDGAIMAHTKWKRRLQAAVSGAEKLDPATIRRDDQCDLGKWLHGEGKVHAKHADYGKLVSSHATFHTCAADVVVQINAGKPDKATQMLAMGSDFVRTSSTVVMLIASIRDALAPPSGSAPRPK